MLGEQLTRAVERRHAAGLPSDATTAYRLVHGAADGLEGLTVDVYERHLVASVYTEDDGAREAAWIAALGALGYEGVYLKRRPRQANQLDAAQRRERAPERAVVGLDAPAAFAVREHGLSLEVRLGDGLSTGVFLDQRDNRARLAAEARGRSVLNLFAYTCAFGAAAARGGACRTVNIDVAKGVLERGRRNYALNGLSCDGHAFLARDVLDALPRMAKKAERFDLVVLDPPSYASTRTGRFSVERDYATLVTLAVSLVADGGTLLACTNHHKLDEQVLVGVIEAGVRSAGRRVRALDLVPPPVDHPQTPGRTPHLKSAWIRL